jgi:hypothetical protein
MFITKVDIRKEKALIIGSYSDTSRIGITTTLRTILRHAQNINFDQHYIKKRLYI